VAVLDWSCGFRTWFWKKISQGL